ncbi:MAG: response regulator [Clostridium sp.]
MNIIAVDHDETALRDLVGAIKEALTNINLWEFHEGSQALDFFKDHHCDIAFLDIDLGDMNGIALAKQIKQISPRVNIIFVTRHMEYAEEAFSIYASGYLRKPVSKEKILSEAANLRYPVPGYLSPRIRIQTFGHFEVFVNEKPLHFANAKAKELFALLVDRRGAGLTTAEISSILWENEPYSVIQKNKVQKAIMQMRNTLQIVGCSDILRKEHNSTAVNTEMLFCDYYEFLKKNDQYIRSFTGEYMAQYSWAEETAAFLLTF